MKVAAPLWFNWPAPPKQSQGVLLIDTLDRLQI
ncbi:hypothetical protein AGR1C_Lc90112 [Agrobacterium fabacearum TT111]|nr:hypothetical protein AGR1C_Lc90112 [Agrobacterium fabacearum TT111]